MTSAHLLRAAFVTLVATLPFATPARGDTLDTSMPRVVVTGAPRGAAPSERLDPRRTGRAHTRLPASPTELWRRQVSGNIDVSPVVDDRGAVVAVLTNAELVKIGPDAKELWRVKLGSGNPSVLAPPTLLSDGTVAVVTSASIAWGFSPNGVLRFSTPLGVARRDADVAPLALSDGGLLVAAGNSLVELDADGVVRARAQLDERSTAGEHATGAVIDAPGGALITTLSGNVYRFRAPAPPRKIGSFGGSTSRGAVLADERTLLAVVDGRRVVAFDLLTGTAHVRAGGLAFDGPPSVSPGGLALLGTQIGLLLGVDAAGNERVHVMLDKPPPAPTAPSPTGVFTQVAELKPSPPIVVDDSGRVAFVRSNGRLGVVTIGEDTGKPGRVEIASERVCATPVAILPAGDKRMLVACRDGALWMYGE
jgi:outer membrane protein assembly factor BamB